MRKTTVYAGLLLLAIAVAAFAAWFYLYSSIPADAAAALYNYTRSNVTISPGDFSYSQVPTGNSTTGTFLFAVLSSDANVYLFDYAAMQSWANNTGSNGSVTGLAYARALASAGRSAVVNNGSAGANGTRTYAFFIVGSNGPASMQTNKSTVYLSEYNLTAYIVKEDNSTSTEYLVIDNTNGSASSNTAVIGIVLRGTYSESASAAFAAKYHTDIIGDLSYLWAATGLFGVIFVILGALSKNPTKIDLFVDWIQSKLKRD